MKIRDVVRKMLRGDKLKISGLYNVDSSGTRIWSAALTDAQLYAYWDADVSRMTYDEETCTVFCILKEEE